jgi:NAD(P)H-dependent flavin oxidoreductase YrpB (nitropropane dioxygenase family)
VAEKRRLRDDLAEETGVRTKITDALGCDVPIIAFSHCRDVVAAVTNAGGFGVLGASGFSPDILDSELNWLDGHCGGRSYGIDVLVPLKSDGAGGGSRSDIPESHRAFVNDLMRKYDVPELPPDQMKQAAEREQRATTLVGRASELWDVAAAHPVRLYAVALGTPPPQFVEKAHERGALVGALVGAVAHAERQKAAGVDYVVAQGTEAGGHCGEISTMVLVPDVVDVVGDMPVIAAGGIACGRQVAAALALGAAGVWTGSVWLTTQEAETHPVVKEKFLAAQAQDTVRSPASTGKPARQLRSAWTEEWSDPANPKPLGMPLHGSLIAEAKARIDRAAYSNPGAKQLANYFVGQVVGRLTTVKTARQVMEEMITEYIDVMARLERVNADDMGEE